MIDIKEVEEIHNILIEKFGGAKGIRDSGILESLSVGLTKPLMGRISIQNLLTKQRLFLKALFQTIHSLMAIKEQLMFLRLMLKEYKLDIDASQNEKYDFVICAAKGELTFEAIKQWIRKKLSRV